MREGQTSYEIQLRWLGGELPRCRINADTAPNIEGHKMRLPIAKIPGTNPPRFRWQQTIEAPLGGGQRTVHHEGPLPPSADVAVAKVIEIAEQLQKFKDWVHDYLDAKGVPPEFPNGPHSVAGCRIGDRMDCVFAELEQLREQLKVIESIEANQDAEPYGPRQNVAPSKKERKK